MAGRLRRFWYRVKNWFRTKEGPGEPLRLLCGSEEELRRVTTWICHINPDMFTNMREVVIWYTSECENGKPIEERCGLNWNAIGALQEYVVKWGIILLKYNVY